MLTIYFLHLTTYYLLLTAYYYLLSTHRVLGYAAARPEEAGDEVVLLWPRAASVVGGGGEQSAVGSVGSRQCRLWEQSSSR